MKRQPAACGVGTGINGREAAMQAAQRALLQSGTARPALGLVFAAQEFAISEVTAGLVTLLGETPLWGFSTTCPLDDTGDLPRAVLVVLVSGADLKAQVNWFPNYAQDSQAAAGELAAGLKSEVFLPQEILIAADGIHGSLEPLRGALASLPVRVSGGTAAGDLSFGRTYAIGGRESGPGGLSAALLGGQFCASAGLAHGWRDAGVHFRVTRAQDTLIQALDGAPAVEAYARWFDYPAREWVVPPLSDLLRLYPLGMELPAGDRLVRSVLRVEAGGALRMSAPVPEGAVVHLMSGSADACLSAAQAAAKQALEGLGSARPLLALALVDAAWQALLAARPNQLSAALKSALGGIPLAGAYTFGQLARPSLDQPPVLHNQNIEVLIIGEA